MAFRDDTMDEEYLLLLHIYVCHWLGPIPLKEVHNYTGLYMILLRYGKSSRLQLVDRASVFAHAFAKIKLKIKNYT